MTNLPAILCVDDEENVLNGLQRILFEHFEVTIASGGEEALALMNDKEFSVIISDMRMPNMNGAEFLSKASEKAHDSTRILLTGHSDLEAAIAAINDGHIFRFLIKPCPEEKLITHINEAVRLHRLVKAEKDLLENTLKSAIRVLTETLSTIAPNAFSRSIHIKNYVNHMVTSAEEIKQYRNRWEFEIAAMLCHVGAIILPPDLLKKSFSAIPLNSDEKEMLNATPAAGAKLVANIPRLENIADMIKHQFASDEEMQKLSKRVEVGARMLRIANTLDRILLREDISVKKALSILSTRFESKQDQQLLKTLLSYQRIHSGSVISEVSVGELRSGMILEEDVHSNNGSIVLCKGQELNAPLIDRLLNFSKGIGIKEPFNVSTRE